MAKKDKIEPGYYITLDPEKYYGYDAVGSSKLKAFAESPLHFHKFTDKPDTAAMKFGRAFHCLMESEKYFNRYYITYEGRSNAVANKHLKEDSREMIKIEDYEKIIDMRDSVLHSSARDYLIQEGFPEVSIIWKDGKIECKGRIDKIIPSGDKHIMVDFKTIMSAAPSDCFRAIANHKYWLQEAHYISGYKKLTGYDAEMVFIFIEKSSPFDVCVVKLSDAARAEALERYKMIMKELKSEIKANNWPGRCSEVLEWEFLE